MPNIRLRLLLTVSGLALALLTGLGLPALVHAADCVVLSPNVTNTILRKSPAASGDPIGTLSSGQSFPLVASVPRWYETRLTDGRPAFASKQSTDIAPCPAVIGVAPTPSGTSFEVHAIDVGTGLSILVRGPDFSLLYDAGSNDDTARGDDNRTIAYLKTLQPSLQRIDHIVLSHPHRDHVELLPDVVTQYSPREVWNSGAYNNICGYRNFLFAVAADPAVQYHTANQDTGSASIALPAKSCYGVSQPAQTLTMKHAKRIVADEKIALGQGASMTFLYADGSKRSSFNENSLVALLELGSRRVLIMGDAEAGGRNPPATEPSDNSIEGKLLACCIADLKADVLVVGHHGSKTSSRRRFLDAVAAQIFVISAGPTKYSQVVLPDAEVVTELESRGQVFRTDLEDDACLMSPDKVGPDADGNAGGCDNVLVTIPPTGPIAAEYRRVSD